MTSFLLVIFLELQYRSVFTEIRVGSLSKISFLVLFLLVGVAGAVDPDSFEDGKLNEVGAARWWCPASNWGKANLEWPESKMDIVNRISQNTNTFVPANHYNENTIFRQLGRSVGRFETYWWKPSENGYAMSVCTATIVAGDYIITNRHCVTDDAEGSTLVKAQIRMNYLDESMEGEVYKVDISKIEINAALDYAVIGVQGFPFSKYGKVDFAPRDPESGEEIFIIQHPAGLPQKVVSGCHVQNDDVDSGSNSYFHSCETKGGSSGSIIFSARDNAVVGLHYASIKPEYEDTVTAPFFKFSKRTKRIGEDSDLLKNALPNLDPDRKRTGWVAIGSPGLAGKQQVWATRNSKDDFLAYINEYYQKGYAIQELSYSKKAQLWAVILTETSKTQSYIAGANWGEVAEWISKKHDDSYQISDVVFGDGTYMVSMNQKAPEDLKPERLSWYATFPSDEMQEMRSKGWRVKELAYDESDENKPWLVIYEESPEKRWTWVTGDEWPSEKINELYKDGWVIDNATFVDGSWVVFLGSYSESISVPWDHRPSYLPDVVIGHYWESGFGLYQLVPGG